jgi:hypothetical protein
VAAGTPAHANNASVTPALYAGAAANDIIFVWAATRGNGSLSIPAGYTKCDDPSDGSAIVLYAKVHSGSESAPTINISGGVSGDTVSAFTFGFRNMPTTLALSSVGEPGDLLVVRAQGSVNSSQQNMPFNSIYPYGFDGCVLLLLCWKAIDYTSVAPPAGWTEMIEASTTVGNHQSLYACYQIQGTAAGVPPDQAVVTGGSAANSFTVVCAFQGGFQTMTATRGVNGAAFAHSAGALVSVRQPEVLSL